MNTNAKQNLTDSVLHECSIQLVVPIWTGENGDPIERSLYDISMLEALHFSLMRVSGL